MENVPGTRVFLQRVRPFCVLVLVGCFVAPALAVDRIVDHTDGTGTDNRTGLMWAATDNGSPINWPSALYYCQSYNGGGHIDWRRFSFFSRPAVR